MCKGGFANYHHILHFLIVEAGDCLIPTHFLAVAAILALNFFSFLVDLVYTEAMVEDKERSPPSHKEGKMFFKIGVVRTVALAHLPTQEGESNDLVVNREVEFVASRMEVVRMEERVLESSLNCYLLLAYDNLIGLVKAELRLGELGDTDRPLP